jgi:hypothetical protein
MRNEPIAPTAPPNWDYTVFHKRKSEMGCKAATELLDAFRDYTLSIRSVVSTTSMSGASSAQLRHDFSPIAEFLGFAKLSLFIKEATFWSPAEQSKLLDLMDSAIAAIDHNGNPEWAFTASLVPTKD